MTDITAQDIERLCAEMDIGNTDTDAWMENNHVPFGTINMIATVCYNAFLVKIGMMRQDPTQAFCETVANSFILGWEASRQFGERKA